jgi:molybdate transport system ATP-binding protein
MSLYCGIEKNFGPFHLNVEFDAGDEVVSVMGASGSGKSMTLRCIAGIEKPDAGRIVLNGRTLFDSEKKIHLPPQLRKTGFLFQDLALFPNMTVLENIRLAAPRRAKISAEKYIESFGLEGLGNRYPDQLSGGQKQRCAIARMLASEPEILMFDEPFSALDTHLRWQMEREIARTIDAFDGTVLLVSHNRDEVYRLSDRVTVLTGGTNEILQTKEDLFFRPVSYADALLTGCKNIFPASNHEGEIEIPGLGLTFTCPNPPENVRYAGIRAKRILPAHTAQPNGEYLILDCKVLHVTESVFTYILEIMPKNGTASIYWEIDKAAYAGIRDRSAVIAIPRKELMLLM